MNQKRILSFMEVAKQENLHRAAQILGVSSAALSKQIAALETEWNLNLFSRTNKGLILTPAGTSMLRDMEYMYEFYEKAIESARHENEKRDRLIRVGTSNLGGGHLLRKHLEVVTHQHNEFMFEFVTLETSNAQDKNFFQHLGEDIDLFLGGYDPNALLNQSYSSKIIAYEPLDCVVPRRHALSPKKTLQIADLKGEHCLLFHGTQDENGNYIRAQLEQCGVIVEEFSQYCDELFNQCENNNQILFTLHKWKSLNPLMRVIPLEWDCRIPVCVYYSRAASTDVLEFVKVL